LFCCIEPKFWRNFCTAVDRPDLLDQHDSSGAVDFGVGRGDLRRELQTIFHQRDLAEWVRLASDSDIAMGPAYATIEEAARDPHLRSRNIIVQGEHPVAGPFTYVGEAAKVSGQSYEVRRHAPALGEHTVEVLRDELGVTADELAQLRNDKVI
jgi:crotonobetainyl-CoA:carnitine CoA-transferase CaiB-like acyl-CoA transferase